MKFLLVSACILFLHLAHGQKTINNTRSEKHQQIPGTKFILVPPAGFINATSFQGFQHTNGQSFVIATEIPGPYEEISKGLTGEGLKTQGVVLKTKEPVRMNSMDGIFMTSEQFANDKTYTKYILVFGNPELTCMMTGIFPKEDQTLDSTIRESMFSVIYDAGVVADPLEASSFIIDPQGTKLQFAKSMAGSLMYSTDGKVPTESADKTHFLVGLSFADVRTIDQKRTALDRIKRLPYKDMEIAERDIREISIDGISGYEISGEGVNPNSGKKDLVYQVMLFTDNGYYIMVGTAKSDFEENLKLFGKLAKTFRRK